MRVNRFLHLLLALPFAALSALEIPLDIHGGGFFGKYLNSDTARFNFDASVGIYCTTLRHGPLSTYVFYRDDLDMGEQTGGVSIDPRYAHYYIAAGIDYALYGYVITCYFMHDCIHDIDYDVAGTPVFNRLRLRFAPADFHYATRLKTERKFLWSVDLGFYPHWNYHGWDINSGADYTHDLVLDMRYNLISGSKFGLDFKPSFTIARGDTAFYHQHILRLQTYYKTMSRRIGMSLDYHLFVNDPIKSPDKLWLLSIYLDF
ncbi:hypothetical protein IBX73_05785 [candidate division WOR-3 bacterium]|nr:hypothetical protein [candidate division WOR-3 bacterium]